MPLLAPSILSADFANLEREVKRVEEAGADLLHVDVMDGRFVPNITIGPCVVESVRKVTSLPLDVHLMIVEPERYVEDFVKAGANLISFHFEATVHHHRLVEKLKSLEVKVGIALNPSTPVSFLEEILSYLDFVLIMTVNPGFGGQKLIDSALLKVKKLKKMIKEKELNLLIEVDGGVKLSNLDRVLEVGTDIAVAGSAVFKGNPIENVKAFKRRMK